MRKVEHSFGVTKCQFGFTKARYKGLVKNTVQLMTLFALSNVWMARRHLLGERTQGMSASAQRASARRKPEKAVRYRPTR